MPNSYKIKLSSFNQEGLKDVIQILETVFQKFDVDFYLIGALAKDMWLSKEKVQSRATKDVDLAVFVSESDAYENIKSTLIKEHNFKEVSTNAFALLTPYGYPVDLLPFGSVEIDEAVEIEGDGLTKVHVNGFKEIYQQGIAPVLTDEGITFKIASLASIILLKLIAFDDRPERRTQDIKDIALILDHYFHIESNEIYNHHNDLFGNEDYELIDIAAIVIGREMQSVLSSNKLLQDRILNILSLSERHHKKIPTLMAQSENFTIDQATLLLKKIAEGIGQL
ncbi:nucleotidyl transferase AbiEii/AbiGii toxin family protein [Fodinibius sediminis]|uniref:Predicted nucleotidyltransferase n=1 Tax=Fodinibius sediminis TaxID=1214077 RepID=A0A521ASW8_9BACT|nr:nucleotidyl transferase AbiEii/AbiGii toxin family protein [Fodinibius sediminis]SMO37913.1 Predicted nucleotidyltransferase [Fodinibius sediminis]